MRISCGRAEWLDGLEMLDLSTDIAASVMRRNAELVAEVRSELDIVSSGDGYVRLAPASPTASEGWVGRLSPLYPEWLGDDGFVSEHGVRFPYVAGAMANGIATARLVVAMGRAQMLGFFGSAGLSPPAIERGLSEIEQGLSGTVGAWGANLINSPNEPQLEADVAALFLARRVHRVSASAYMSLTPPVVRYACTGLRSSADGRVRRTNHVFAKVSRPEVAVQFMRPAPSNLLEQLVTSGQLTPEEARLGSVVPVATAVTAESDSGGHTDHRPLGVLLPALLQLRDEVESSHGYEGAIRVGAAGGLGTPSAVAAAFALGAAYVVTGSVNQAAVESGVGPDARKMLAAADLADVGPAAAADMFEQGVKVQVLTRGTMFAARANKLYDLYRRRPHLDALSADERAELERTIFRSTLDEAWAATADFWSVRDPSQLDRAARDPKHKMALLFRSYLGRSSRWAIDDVADRRIDYQLWCGPAMGGFNRWVKGSFLEPPEQRTVVQIARNLMEGAAKITRAHQARSLGVPLARSCFEYRPRPLGDESAGG